MANAGAGTVAGLRSAAGAEGVTLEFVAPVIGGVAASGASLNGAGQQIDGGPPCAATRSPLLEATGIRELLDDGFIRLGDGPDAAAGLVETCRRAPLLTAKCPFGAKEGMRT